MILTIYQCLHLIVVGDFPDATAPVLTKCYKFTLFYAFLGVSLIRGCAIQQSPERMTKMFFVFVVQISYHRSWSISIHMSLCFYPVYFCKINGVAATSVPTRMQVLKNLNRLLETSPSWCSAGLAPLCPHQAQC